MHDGYSTGGRDTTADQRTKTVLVRSTDSPRTDRHVTLRSARLLATDLYVVAVVDGTGKLADPTSLTVTPSLDRARTAANRLIQKWSAS